MRARIPVGASFGATKLSHADTFFKVKFGTIWDFEHYRKGCLIDQWTQGNVCTSEGLTNMLEIMFHSGTQITTWHLLLFSTNTTPDDATTYAVPVFTEVNAKINEATRPACTFAAAATKSITNTANKATFTFNDTETVYGAALVGGGTNGNTKGDTAGGGTLFCAAKFGSSKSVVATDVLLITCTITLADV